MSLVIKEIKFRVSHDIYLKRRAIQIKYTVDTYKVTALPLVHSAILAVFPCRKLDCFQFRKYDGARATS